MERIRVIKIASLIGIIGNLGLASLKIIVGLATGSLSVLGDGLDSLTDIFISIITFGVSVIVAKPPDMKHPYGHFRAETIATSILAFIMFFIGGQLILSSIDKLLHHNDFVFPGQSAVYVTVVSILGKVLLSLSQYSLGRKAKSDLLIANGKNMLNDVLTSFGVLIGLGVAYFFDFPVIDRILAIAIGFWISLSAVKIFKGILTELMEGEDNNEIYHKIFEVVGKAGDDFNPHRVRIRKIGAMYAVDLDVEINGSLTVNEAHAITQELEQKIHQAIPNLYDIMIHIEPIGNVEEKESYGLCKKDLPKL